MRRKYKLTNKDYAHVNLKVYEHIIIETINNIVPNKNPKVFDIYFSTDVLNQSESVAIGRALSKIYELKAFGKSVMTFRQFDGNNYESEQSTIPINKKNKRIKKENKK